jgi:thiazole synthase ThiGH ThiG subunit
MAEAMKHAVIAGRLLTRQEEYKKTLCAASSPIEECCKDSEGLIVNVKSMDFSYM